MKTFTLLLFTLFTSYGFSQCSEIFFSEYIEGSSNNKALEVYNPSSSTIDMTTYKMYRFNNGASAASDSLFPVGLLAAGDVFVIANPSADPLILAQADTTHTLTFYNGDDVVIIVNQITGDTVDAIGEIGIDPGTNWPVGTGATSEFTLIRMIGIQQGNTDWAIGATEWDVYPQNTFDSLGFHTMTPCTPCTPTSSQVSISNCGPYTSPSGAYTWTTSGQYMDTINNAAGCDSVMTIDLTVTIIDTTISLIGTYFDLQANQTGATYQWYNCDSSSIIVGETNQILNHLNCTWGSTYAVIITVGNCTDTSECLLWEPESIDELIALKYKISPNPTNGTIVLSTENAGDLKSVRVIDALGREVLASKAITQNITSIELTGNAGVYLIQVTAVNGTTHTSRVIKK